MITFYTQQDFALQLLAPMYFKLGIYEKENDTMSEKFLREMVVEWVCRLGHSDCLNMADTTYLKWKDSQLPTSM